MSKASQLLSHRSYINESDDSSMKPPKIGTEWKAQGGIYAGMIRGHNDEPDYYLVYATKEHELSEVTWPEAKKQSKRPINGFKDWSLPNQPEAKLLFINSDSSFDPYGDDWGYYWTSEEKPDNKRYAIVQSFIEHSGGYHKGIGKLREFLSRPIRRVYL